MLYYKQDVVCKLYKICYLFQLLFLRENWVKKIYNSYNVLVFTVWTGKNQSNKWAQSGFKIGLRITFIKLDKVK